MDLKEYLKKEKITYAYAAQIIGCTQQAINSICNKHKFASKRLAKLIEDFTNGQVLSIEVMGEGKKIICPCCERIIYRSKDQKKLKKNLSKFT